MRTGAFLSAAFVLLSVSPPALLSSDDWAESPEASFLTREERRQWKRLDTVDAREEFTRMYWRRRDPTPGTDDNEFRDMVLARVRAADQRFGTPERRGSLTARGGVYIVLGAPAVVRSTSGPLETTPRQELPGVVALPQTALHGNAWEEWIYDRDRNAELLKTLRRPTVEIAFTIEGGRDQLQKTGIFAAYRETIARSTIVSSP